jgi:hypothetical protein
MPHTKKIKIKKKLKKCSGTGMESLQWEKFLIGTRGTEEKKYEFYQCRHYILDLNLYFIEKVPRFLPFEGLYL